MLVERPKLQRRGGSLMSRMLLDFRGDVWPVRAIHFFRPKLLFKDTIAIYTHL